MDLNRRVINLVAVYYFLRQYIDVVRSFSYEWMNLFYILMTIVVIAGYIILFRFKKTFLMSLSFGIIAVLVIVEMIQMLMNIPTNTNISMFIVMSILMIGICAYGIYINERKEER